MNVKLHPHGGNLKRKWARILILDSISTTYSGVLREKELCHYSEYHTKFRILDIYDRMQYAIDTGEPYQALFNPPPGPPADEHGNFLPFPEWKPGHSKPPNWPPHIHSSKEVADAL